jgi:ribosome-binding factor A
MSGYRIDRTNDDIQIVLSELLRSIKDPRVNQGMLSVTRTETTGDLRYCKVYVSVYGLENEKELKKGLKSASGWLRRELSKKLSLRYTPELIFELDDSIEHGAHINKIISAPGFIRQKEQDESMEGKKLDD